jgi:hypothetical protein
MKIINQKFNNISENKIKLFTLNMIIKELENSFNLLINTNIKLRIAEYIYNKKFNEYRIIKNYYNRKVQENILLINTFHYLLKTNKFNDSILESKNIKFRKFIEIILNPLIKKNTYFIMDTIDTLNKKSTNNDRLIKLLTYYKTNFKIIFT